MIRLFVGQDSREWVGLNVFCSSVWGRTSESVSITPIHGPTDGTNAFTLSRFNIPALCDYRGFALWADGSDMVCLADIAELWALRDPFKAVQVVQHDYQTQHPVKYLGQKNEDYPRKNWSSLMLINCAHYAWRHIEKFSPQELHRFSFLPEKAIGDLPPEWNVLVGEQSGPAKILHYTIGLPIWKPYQSWPESIKWHEELKTMLGYAQWEGL